VNSQAISIFLGKQVAQTLFNDSVMLDCRLPADTGSTHHWYRVLYPLIAAALCRTLAGGVLYFAALALRLRM